MEESPSPLFRKSFSFESDMEAASPPTLTKSRSSETMSRIGPSTISGLQTWPIEEPSHCLDYATNQQQDLPHLKKGISYVMTFHYAGAGTAEVASTCAAKGFGENVRCKVHSSSDFSKPCRDVLLQHTGPSRPGHVLGDIMQRIPTSVRKELETACCRFQEQAKAQIEAGVPRLVAVTRVGELAKQAYINIISRTKIEEKVWCYRHNRKCSVLPDLADGELLADVSGSNCQPWTQKGQQWGWLDCRSLPLFVYLLQFQKYTDKLAFLLVENSPAFDISVFSDVYPEATVNSLVFSMVDVGVPEDRSRRWTAITFDKVGLSVGQSDSLTLMRFRCECCVCAIVLPSTFLASGSK